MSNPNDDVDTSDITAAPPQPPLPSSDTSFSLPEIVHGIDPEDENDVTSGINPALQHSNSGLVPSLLHQSSISEVFSSISARVQRAVGLSNRNPMVSPPPALFLFGDSLTEYSVNASDPTVAPGWATLLREAYGGDAEVFVRGHSGYNSRWALHILPRELHSVLSAGAHIKLVTIFFGANDACAPGEDQHISPTEYCQNLETMVGFVRSLGLSPLLITPTPFVPSDNSPSGNRTPPTTAHYAHQCLAVGDRVGCPVLDLHTGLINRAGPDGLAYLFNDGLHFSTAGNVNVYQLFTEKLAQIAPELDPATMPRLAISWREINPQDPSASLGHSELLDQ